MNLSPLPIRFLACTVFACSVGLAACGADPREASLTSAKGYLAKNDLKSGIIELKNTLQKQDIPEARFLLGKALLDSEAPMAASVELRKARALGYSDELVLPLLARAFLDSGNLADVIALDETAALNSPEAVAAFKTILAHALVGRGNSEMAETALRAALAAKPDYSPALLFDARLLADKGALDAAFEIVNQLIGSAPDDAAAVTLKADLLQFGRRDLPGALIEYRKALARSPLDLDANSGLLTLLLATNDVAAARAQLKLLKEGRPKHTQTLYFEARLAAQTGDLDTANRLAEQLLRSSSDNVQFLQLAGLVALATWRTACREQHLRRIISTLPAAVAARHGLARVYLQNGEPEKALAALKPLLESPVPDGETQALAGTANLLMGDTKRQRNCSIAPEKAEPGTARFAPRWHSSAVPYGYCGQWLGRLGCDLQIRTRYCGGHGPY
jgi:putative PEP-CTERM system TPR-repeat lipoprotein